MLSLEKFIAALDGISYNEWLTLREVMDMAFEKEERELKRKLKLSNICDVQCEARSYLMRKSRENEAETKKFLKQAYEEMHRSQCEDL